MLTPPTIGRIVNYVLTESDAEHINRRRTDARRAIDRGWHNYMRTGAMVHVGNDVQAGETYPMVITRVWSHITVNGQVLLDGTDTLWVTSTSQGDGPRSWAWPDEMPYVAPPAPAPKKK